VSRIRRSIQPAASSRAVPVKQRSPQAPRPRSAPARTPVALTVPLGPAERVVAAGRFDYADDQARRAERTEAAQAMVESELDRRYQRPTGAERARLLTARVRSLASSEAALHVAAQSELGMTRGEAVYLFGVQRLEALALPFGLGEPDPRARVMADLLAYAGKALGRHFEQFGVEATRALIEDYAAPALAAGAARPVELYSLLSKFDLSLKDLQAGGRAARALATSPVAVELLAGTDLRSRDVLDFGIERLEALFPLAPDRPDILAAVAPLLCYAAEPLKEHFDRHGAQASRALFESFAALETVRGELAYEPPLMETLLRGDLERGAALARAIAADPQGYGWHVYLDHHGEGGFQLARKWESRSPEEVAQALAAARERAKALNDRAEQGAPVRLSPDRLSEGQRALLGFHALLAEEESRAATPVLEELVRRLGHTVGELEVARDYVASGGRVVIGFRPQQVLPSGERVIDAFARDDRYRTSFETGTTSEAVMHEWGDRLSQLPRLAEARERRVFGPQVALGQDEHPPYAALTPSLPDGMYGNARLVLSDEVRRRATVTLPLSSAVGTVEAFDHVLLHAGEQFVKGLLEVATGKRDRLYPILELEIFGGVRFDEDVEAVAADPGLKATPVGAALEAFAEARGVPLRWTRALHTLEDL
jgi:hypothetical protein